MEKQTDGRCVICKSPIIERIIEKYDPESGPIIFGPGGKNQYRKVSEGFNCSNKKCGLKYAFVPKR